MALVAFAALEIHFINPTDACPSTLWASKASFSEAVAQGWIDAISIARAPLSNRGASLALDEARIALALAQHTADSYVGASVPAQKYSSATALTSTWFDYLTSADPLILALELFMVAILCLGLGKWTSSRAGRSIFYDDVVTLCKYNNISLTELATTTTLVVGFVFFDIFVSFNEDDVIDAFNYLILLFVILTFVFMLIAVDIQYFFMVSNAGGDLTFRIVCFDLVNNVLCALRVFFC